MFGGPSLSMDRHLIKSQSEHSLLSWVLELGWQLCKVLLTILAESSQATTRIQTSTSMSERRH